jgi:hypothetical protein
VAFRVPIYPDHGYTKSLSTCSVCWLKGWRMQHKRMFMSRIIGERDQILPKSNDLLEQRNMLPNCGSCRACMRGGVELSQTELQHSALSPKHAAEYAVKR